VGGGSQVTGLGGESRRCIRARMQHQGGEARELVGGGSCRWEVTAEVQLVAEPWPRWRQVACER
jgi:hypothetical protein